MSTDLHTLSGAYALDALSPDEVAAFRTHLDGCQACCEEVRELRAAAARMGEVEAVPAPAALRARVLGAARVTPQLPPLVIRYDERPAPGGWTRRFSPRLLAGAVAASVVLLAGAVAGIVQLTQDDTPALSAAVSQVFNAPDSHHATVSTSNGGQLKVATSASLRKMAVDTEGLPALSKAQVYQIWAVHDGTMTSAGLVVDLGDGAAMAMPAAGTEVAITIEPDGGSVRPTTSPIVTVDPASV